MSILTCYHGHKQVIICDDCSQDQSYTVITEATKEIMKHYSNIEFIILNNNNNIGVTNTINRCLSYVSSSFIYLIASDDYFVENGVSVAIKKLISTKADALINDCYVVDSENKVIHKSAFFGLRKTIKKNLIKDSIKDELVFNWNVPGPALLIRSSVYSSIGNYDSSLIIEDRDFYLRLLSGCHVEFNDIPVAYYRVHSNNYSRKKSFNREIRNEIIHVNYKYYSRFGGLSKIYLRSYWLDIHNVPFLITKFLRKIIKYIYIIKSKKL